MRIVHIFWGLTFGGIETMLVNIANEQAKLGNDVTILLINDLYEQTLVESLYGNVKFMTMGRKRKSLNPTFLFRLNMSLLKINPDVIHLHGSALYGFLLNKKLSRITCSTLHDIPHGRIRIKGILYWSYLWNAIKRKGNVTLIDKIPKVFTISLVVHDELLERFGVESIVVNNGIIIKNFKQRNSRLPNGMLKIVQVSRLHHEKKGQDILIKAVAKLKNKNISVDFIGEGKSLEYLKALALELGVSDKINFLGKCFQDYIAEHLCDYDLFIQPSLYEGFGLTVAEAMAAKVPVLVSSGQGPAEVCCNNRYGWTFENGIADELADKISYILNHYEEALNKADLGLKYVYKTYDVSVTAHKYVEEYKKLRK